MSSRVSQATRSAASARAWLLGLPAGARGGRLGGWWRRLVGEPLDDFERSFGAVAGAESVAGARRLLEGLEDLPLLPEHRGQGIGGELMRDLLAEGKQKELPVRIHVERFNPALRLYQRLGFRHVEDQGPYYLMEWRPGAT